ncbi:MAG: glycosyltransferase [Lachnospiraceae bacterium]|nr:glycosyltransferase [Lachnospiraceae bacterium]
MTGVIRLGFLRIRHFFRMLRQGYGIKESAGTCLGLIKPVKYDTLVRQKEAEIPHPEGLEYEPLVSIIIPTYNIEDRFLRPCLDSCLAQTYKNFEVCVSDDNSSLESVRKTLKEYEEKYDNFFAFYRSENGRISENTNSALKIASGEFVALVDDDDLLEPYSLLEMVRYLNEHPDTDIVYSDEDMLTEDGRERHDPKFKPDWSPDSFFSIMYTCHLCMIRKSLIEQAGGFDKRYDGAQDYDLIMRLSEITDRIGHVPQVLYHWREISGSTALDMSAKSYLKEATVKLKEAAMERRGEKGHLEWCPLKEVVQCYAVYDTDKNDKVSIVIPSKDNYKVLRRCIESIYSVAAGVDFEVVVVDNGSNEKNRAKIEKLLESHGCKYIYEPLKFNFSRMCNIGASNSSGNIILFLNDDIKVQGEGWLSRMAGHAKLPHVGAVGCKLYYPKGKMIQHCGVVNTAVGPGHAFYGIEDTLVVMYGGRNLLPYNFIVVTGAALMLERSKYEEAGGFDESLAVAYNDVALCFSLLEKGYKNVLRPDVSLIHYESVSRGIDAEDSEKTKRRIAEMDHLYELHPSMKGVDPCYNPNFKNDNANYKFE